MIGRNWAGGSTRPEGFEGEWKKISLVHGVIARSTWSTLSTKSVSSVSMKTGVPPAKTTTSGNVTQYGFGMSASSPGFNKVTTALKTACLAPAGTDRQSVVEGKSAE